MVRFQKSLMICEFVAADGTDFVRINSQAFEAEAIFLVNLYNTINLFWSINSFLKKLRQISEARVSIFPVQDIFISEFGQSILRDRTSSTALTVNHNFRILLWFLKFVLLFEVVIRSIEFFCNFLNKLQDILCKITNLCEGYSGNSWHQAYQQKVRKLPWHQRRESRGCWVWTGPQQ